MVGRPAPKSIPALFSRGRRRTNRELKVRCSNQLSYSPTTILQGAAEQATGLQNGRKTLESRRKAERTKAKTSCRTAPLGLASCSDGHCSW